MRQCLLACIIPCLFTGTLSPGAVAGQIRSGDPVSPQLEFEARLPQEKIRDCQTLSFTAGGDVIYAVFGQSALGWNIATKKVVFRIKPGETDLYAFLPLLDGKAAVTLGTLYPLMPLQPGANCAALRFWRLNDGKCLDKMIVSKLLGDGECIIANYDRLGLSADGRSLVSLSLNGISVWDLRTGELRRKFKVDGDHSVLLSPNGTQLVARRPGWIARWNVADGKELPLQGFAPLPRADVPSSFYDSFDSVAFSPDGRWLVTSMSTPGKNPETDDGTDRTHWLWIWDAATGKRVVAMKTAHPLGAIHFHPDGKHFLCQGVDRAGENRHPVIDIWNLERRASVFTWQPPADGILVAIAPDGRRFAMLFADGTVRVWTWPLDRVR